MMYSYFQRIQSNRQRQAIQLAATLQLQMQDNKRLMPQTFKFMTNTTVTGSTWWTFICYMATTLRHGTKNATAVGANKHAGGHRTSWAATTHAQNAWKATTFAKNAIHSLTDGTPKSRQKLKTTASCCNRRRTTRTLLSSTKMLKSWTIHNR